MKTDDTLHIKNFIEAINRADNTRQKNISFEIIFVKRFWVKFLYLFNF